MRINQIFENVLDFKIIKIYYQKPMFKLTDIVIRAFFELFKIDVSLLENRVLNNLNKFKGSTKLYKNKVAFDKNALRQVVNELDNDLKFIFALNISFEPEGLKYLEQLDNFIIDFNKFVDGHKSVFRSKQKRKSIYQSDYDFAITLNLSINHYNSFIEKIHNLFSEPEKFIPKEVMKHIVFDTDDDLYELLVNTDTLKIDLLDLSNIQIKQKSTNETRDYFFGDSE